MISVIVPVYKVEKYLRDCVDSILSQTYTDFELILVDDGSPDICGEICDEYAAQDPRVRVIHQENQGLSGARNAGIDAARGDYLTFIDSDDMVSPEYISVLLQALEDADADLSVCRTFGFIDGEDPKAERKEITSQIVVSGTDACIMLYDGRAEIPVNAWGKLFRTAVIGELRFPLGRLHEDQAFTPLVCYRAKKVSSVDADLYYYRGRDDSITRDRFTVKRYDDLWAIDQCISFFEKACEEDVLKAAYRKRKRLLATYSIYARRDGVEIPKDYRVPLLFSLLYLRKNVQPIKYEYYLAQISPKLAILYEYERKLWQILKRK